MSRCNDLLNWDDLSNMFTWSFHGDSTNDSSRIRGFRKTLEDREYEGFLIPKGWQIFWVIGMTHMDEEISRSHVNLIHQDLRIHHPYLHTRTCPASSDEC